MSKKISTDRVSMKTIYDYGHTYTYQYEQVGTSPTGEPVYGYVRYDHNTRISGYVNANTSSVYSHGKKVIAKGALTTESDSPIGDNGHSGASGSVTSGNNQSVYVEGKLIAGEGSPISTHSGASSEINGGVSNVYVGT